MENSDFSKAIVGDHVWSSSFGWGVVNETTSDTIKVQFTVYNWWYDFYGKLYNYKVEQVQSLFWDEIKIVPPPKPKKIVTKSISMDINWYKTVNGNVYYPGALHVDNSFWNTIKKLWQSQQKCKMTLEYEEEE